MESLQVNWMAVAVFLIGLIAGNAFERFKRFAQLERAKRELDRAKDQLITRAGGLPISESGREEVEKIRRQDEDQSEIANEFYSSPLGDD